mmetsp:Transcript_68311/g.220979  ORF Transcript_68311/g.220979 Transcript_68311/m.220979 type:complete len:407 (-) Transcript_68311:80-1300(-)
MEQADGILDQLSSIGAARSPIPVSNMIGGIVAGFSICRLFTDSVDEGFALVPHHTVFTTVAFCPVPFLWNVVTAHFFEANLLKAVLVTPCLVALTRLLERLWTAQAIVLHLLFTAAGTGFAFFAAELVHVYRTHHEKEWFEPTRGCSGLLVAVALGVRHAYPLERIWGVQSQHLPFGMACGYAFVGLLVPGLLEDWAFAPLAFFFGWVHLRYLMWFPTAQAFGDHSPDFTFASLFPRALRPVVGCLGSGVHSLTAAVAPSFVQLRQVGDVGNSITYDPSKSLTSLSAPAGPGASSGPVVPGGPGSKEYAARRAKALALLDQNIKSLFAPESSSRPSGLSRTDDDAGGAAAPALASPPQLAAEAATDAPTLAAAPQVRGPGSPAGDEAGSGPGSPAKAPEVDMDNHL